ncbi:MAG: DUF7662 domain-containing protein [Pseudonocardiaceae bacterium]
MHSDGTDKAIWIRHSDVVDHVRRVRQRHPGATLAELVAALEKTYIDTVTGTGAAVGAIAATPGVGSVVALALAATEGAVLIDRTALFALAVAEVHRMPTHDPHQRRMLLVAIVSGTGGPVLTQRTLARGHGTVRRWLTMAYGIKRWILGIGKALPFGIGAAIGATSNRAYSRRVVAASRQVFGPVTQTTAPAISDAAIPGPGSPAPVAAPVSATIPVTRKYRPLFSYLAADESDHVEIGFSEISQMVPGGLPKSALTRRSWWRNSAHGGQVQAKAWLDAGFTVTDVDLAAKTVRFTRPPGSKHRNTAGTTP